MTDQEDNKFVLRADLRDHLDQVRSITAYPITEGAVVTCSLDRTVKIWLPKDHHVANEEMDTAHDDENDKDALLRKKSQYVNALTLIGHENFVLDVTYWSPCEQNEMTGNIVSTSHDKSVIIWHMDGTMKDRYINAHTGPISCVAVDPTTHNLITGSWDRTAKVWFRGTAIQELKGHEQNVLCVLAASNGDIITGSGDGSIRIWRDGKCIKNITGAHGAPVRSVTEQPGMGFISTSNDCMVKVWTLTGDIIHQFQAHDNLVYSCAILSSNEIATASEDKTVKIWRDYQLIQTIDHPGCVWKVIVLSNGDIATACADGSARIFTRNKDKIADPEIVKNMDDLIMAQKKKISGVDPSTLPQVGILPQVRGKSDGEVKLVANNGVPEAYSWNAKQEKWDKMGELVDGPAMGSGFAGKTYYNGSMYDYVFDIELEAGAGLAKYKLPYNRGENPYEAAQQFIWKNNLSQYHLDQIAKFVINNSDQPNLITQQSMRGDPFTGHQREMGSGVPPPSSGSQNSNVELSAYAKEQLQHAKELEERERQKKVKHIPAAYAVFDAANYSGITKKINEYKQDTSMNISDEIYKNVTELVDLLKSTELRKIETKHVAAMDELLKLPADKVFPIVDLARLVVLTDAGANYYFQQYQTTKRNVVTDLFNVAFGAEQANHALQMLSIRLLANMFQQAKLRFLAVSDSVSVLIKMKQACHGSTNANLRLAYSFAVHNYGVYYGTYVQAHEAKEQILKIVKDGVPDESNADIVYKFLCGAGTLIGENSDVVALAKKVGLPDVVGQKISSPNAKVAAVAFQVFQLLR